MYLFIVYCIFLYIYSYIYLVIKTKVMKISFEAQKDLAELRKEMKKANPSPEKISNLLCGDKYNIPIKS